MVVPDKARWQKGKLAKMGIAVKQKDIRVALLSKYKMPAQAYFWSCCRCLSLITAISDRVAVRMGGPQVPVPDVV
jgi:hypothetical protein